MAKKALVRYERQLQVRFECQPQVRVRVSDRPLTEHPPRSYTPYPPMGSLLLDVAAFSSPLPVEFFRSNGPWNRELVFGVGTVWRMRR